MTISQEMLAAVRRAKTPLGDSASEVEAFFRGRLLDDGGFANRSGKSDLYYTVFGLQAMVALGAAFPAEPVAGYLASFGAGDALDMLHLSCLARCWASLPAAEAPAALRDTILRRLAACRTPDGGYAQQPHATAGSAYGCFLALGTYQDLDAELPDPDGCARCLAGLAAGDGAFANDTDLPVGSVPATAAAVAVLHHLGRAAPAATAGWLLAQRAAGGGWLVVPGAPEPDLLSTATALHALVLLGADLTGARKPAAQFVLSLRTPGGGFAGHAGDETPDCEYTYYALLALGHLAG